MSNEPWIITHTGRHFNYLNVKPDDIDIEDIAHALSNICRFTGHVNRFYSVAQHCVELYDLFSMHHPVFDTIFMKYGHYLDEDTLKWALLHDASEAYMSDVAAPLKRILIDYGQLELDLMEKIAEKFDLSPCPTQVRLGDMILGVVEARSLMEVRDFSDWDVPDVLKAIPSRWPMDFDDWSPSTAKEMFLECYRALFSEGQQCN